MRCQERRRAEGSVSQIVVIGRNMGTEESDAIFARCLA